MIENLNPANWIKAYDIIKNAKNILLVTHEKPDGDALASTCAMAEILELLKKSYSIYCFDQPSEQFSFLPHWQEFKTSHNFSQADLIIALDCGGLNRTKLEKEISRRSKQQIIIEFDHHPKIDNYADFEFKLAEAAATTEVIYYFMKHNKIKINKNLANCLLTGIITDTANFLYPSTSSQTVTIASEMLAKGAKLPQIMDNTWRNKSLASMKAWGKAMAGLKINKNYNFAISVLTQADIADISDDDLEGIAGFLSNLDNVNGILLLRQQKNGSLKGSLRAADSQLDVSPLARLLGGGGHARASGFTLEGKLIKTENNWQVV